MNKLLYGDCLDILKELNKEHPNGFIDLIYIDPPFNSKRDYNILFEDVDMEDATAQKQAFADTWSNVTYHETLNEIQEIDLALHNFINTLEIIKISRGAISYLTTMAIRIWYMHKVLKDTGSFYLHCDPNMSHYLKIVCDLIFGEKNFKNEISWCYSRATSPNQKVWGRMHDIILFYTKSNEWTFNVDDVRLPYSESSKSREGFSKMFHEEGDLIGGKCELNPKGKFPEDWWQIPFIRPNAKERLGYPTQKPELLLERIIKASSNKGDLVADLFCGCGTTISVAERLTRKWIGVDISHLAIKLVVKRLLDPYRRNPEKRRAIFNNILITGFPKDIASAKELAKGTKQGRLNFQEWVIEIMIGGVLNPRLTADGGWDGHITFDANGKKETVLISVKSGHCGIKDVRELIQVVDKQKAKIGVLVCFKDEVTRGMEHEAKEHGYYDKGRWGSRYDKIQILTIEDLLSGKQVQMPVSEKTTFKKSSRLLESDVEQKGIFE